MVVCSKMCQAREIIPGVGDFELRPDGGRLAGTNLRFEVALLVFSCLCPSGVLLLEVAGGPMTSQY